MAAGAEVLEELRTETTALVVAYVTMQFPARSETFATNEVRTLSGRKVSISVHALRPARPDARQLMSERGVSHVETTHNGIAASLRGLFAGLARPTLLLRTLSWIVRTNGTKVGDLVGSLVLLPRAFDILADIERRAPDVVHMYWGHFPTLVGRLVQAHMPEVVTSMSIVAYDLGREYGGAVDVARRSDVVRTHAQVNVAHVSRFTGLPADRIDVIYNGVDIEWVERIRAAVETIPHRVVASGRLIPEKGMDDVLRAFASIRQVWPDATLVIAGDGPEAERLRAMSDELRIADVVEFIGHVPHARVVEEMAKAEALLLLSRYGSERLPNVVKESMACGCVCVTTPTPGIEELVEHGVTGFVVPMSAPEAAGEVVDGLFSRRLDAVSIRAQGADHVRRHFDLARTAPRYEELWRAAVRRRGQRARAARGNIARDARSGEAW